MAMAVCLDRFALSPQDAAIEYLRRNRKHNCCEICGEEIEEGDICWECEVEAKEELAVRAR